MHYTMPLGLHHLIGGDHYAPMPENTDPRRADWSATYYHRADASGIGYDRTRARQRRRRPVPLAAARAVERSRDHARRAAPVVSPPALGLPHEVGPHAVGRAGPVLQPRRRRGEGRSRRGGRRCAARSMRSGTRRCSPSFTGRRKMPPRGATSASATSRPGRVGCRRVSDEAPVCGRFTLGVGRSAAARTTSSCGGSSSCRARRFPPSCARSSEQTDGVGATRSHPSIHPVKCGPRASPTCEAAKREKRSRPSATSMRRSTMPRDPSCSSKRRVGESSGMACRSAFVATAAGTCRSRS